MANAAQPPFVKLTYSPEEVASLFGWKSLSYLRQQMPNLRKNNFPPKLPGTHRYSKHQVDLWINTNGGKQPLSNDEQKNTGDTKVTIAQAQQDLEQLYAS